jgi:CheY-like chemotaxis protein
VSTTDRGEDRRVLSVVLADNDPVIIDLIATDLALERYDVVATALTGEQAAEACEKWQPDVLVIDFRMPPGWNGLETIARVRDAGSAKAFVLYTNYKGPNIPERARKLGAVYLAKGPLRTLRAALAEVAADIAHRSDADGGSAAETPG